MLPKASCYVHDLTGKKKSLFYGKYIRSDRTSVVLNAWNLDRAREQLHACVKWDLVDRDFFFLFCNFVRQNFRFQSVNFFQIFGAN